LSSSRSLLLFFDDLEVPGLDLGDITAVTSDASVGSGRHRPFAANVDLGCVKALHVVIVVITPGLPLFLRVSVGDDRMVHLDGQVDKWTSLLGVGKFGVLSR
jgi:hypothetical protein